MLHRKSAITLRLITTCAIALPTMTARAQRPNATPVSAPVITSPAHNADVPSAKTRPACPAGPCTTVYVSGRVPPGNFAYVLVGPLSAAPRIWVQPPPNASVTTGAFDALAYLGDEKFGAGERFQIFVCASRSKGLLKDGQVLEGIPDGCLVSEPVTVTRLR
jgi:hypothetical protein